MNFLRAIAVLGYLTKLKRDLGLAFGAHFLMIFMYKRSLFNSLSVKKIQCHTLFLSQKQNVLLISYLGS